MKPLFNEGDLVYFVENDKRMNKVFFVDKTEDFTYDYTWSAAVTTGAISSFTEIANLEPKQVNEPEIQMYQVRAGIDVGYVYTEMLAGTIRRTPFKARRPTTSAPYTGFWNEVSSPYSNPRYEFFLRYNEKPAFAIYNPWGFSITPTMSFRGRKLRLLDIDSKDTARQIGISAEDLKRTKELVIANKTYHRRITVYGMED
jgi:hypothetical protein